jgi:Ca-activated chloride channel family protein
MMDRLILPLLLFAQLLVGSIPLEVPSTPSKNYTIYRRVNEVHVAFTAQDRHGRYLRGLTKSDIAVSEDSRQVESLTALYGYEELRQDVLVLVDTSDSMAKGLPQAARMTNNFLHELARPQLDSITVASFAAQARDLGSARLLNTGLGPLKAEGQTALYDTIYDACQQWTNREPEERHVIVLLSDGEDTWSRHALRDTIDMAVRSDASIYAISAHKRRVHYTGDDVLLEMAEATGGKAFIVPRYDNLAGVFAAIQQDMRAHYVVGFRPTGTAGRQGYHAIAIQIRNVDARVRAREGYFEK